MWLGKQLITKNVVSGKYLITKNVVGKVPNHQEYGIGEAANNNVIWESS